MMDLESPFMSHRFNETPKRILLASLLLALGVSLLLAISCGEGEEEDAPIILPTATPGAMPATPTATVLQSESTGALQVGFNFGTQGQPQQGAGVLTQVGRGTRIEINVRPGLGAVQQASIREGQCDSVGKWIDSVDPAIGGVSNSELKELHIRDIVDGNHLLALSLPGGTFSQIATCANLPDLSHLDLPDEAP